jgi:menaquinone-dependent protoporphyrinogen IX oxidase
MKALVVYEGSTENIAQAICSGLKQSGLDDVECKAVGNVTISDLQKADNWVVGGPSGGFFSGRKVQGLLKRSMGTDGKHSAAVFDTRPAGSSSGMAEKLAATVKGGNINLASSTYFSLGANKVLMDGEENLAVIYGRNLAGLMK